MSALQSNHWAELSFPDGKKDGETGQPEEGYVETDINIHIKHKASPGSMTLGFLFA